MWKYLAGIPAAAFICSPKIVIHVNKLCHGKKNTFHNLFSCIFVSIVLLSLLVYTKNMSQCIFKHLHQNPSLSLPDKCISDDTHYTYVYLIKLAMHGHVFLVGLDRDRSFLKMPKSGMEGRNQ